MTRIALNSRDWPDLVDLLRKAADGGFTASSLSAGRVHLLADHIEAQLPKPKPPEPTGLGAVVEDRTGKYWVRHYEMNGVAWHDGTHLARSVDYAAIEAVRVISEGVVAS